MLSSENLATALRAINAFNTGNRAAFRACFLDDPGVVPFADRVASAVDAESSWQGFWSYLESGWQGLMIVPGETRVRDEGIEIEATLRGRVRGNGRLVESPAHVRFTFSDDRVRSLEVKLPTAA